MNFAVHSIICIMKSREVLDINSCALCFQQEITPEDANVVTSSEDNILSPRTFSTSDIGVQTSKKVRMYTTKT